MSHSRREFLSVVAGGGLLSARVRGQTTGPAAQPAPGEPIESLAIRNVTVIDMTGGSPRQDVTVLLDGGRIVAIAKQSRVTAPAGAAIVDGTGRFLIPGLWDMHAHPDVNALQDFVARGIVGIRSMGARPEHLEVRDEIARGRRVGPQIFAGLKLNGLEPGQTLQPGRDYDELFGGNQRDALQLVVTPPKAKAAVRRAKRLGFDFIKVYNALPRDVYLAIAEEARVQGLPVVGHVPRSVTPMECGEAGQRSIEHVFQIAAVCRDGYAEWRKWIHDNSPSVDKGFGEFEPNLGAFHISRLADVTRTMRKSGSWLCPTLLVTDSVAANAGIERAQTIEIVRTLFKAGIRILAGTDTGAGVYAGKELGWGASLHEELRLLVDAGLTSFDALRTATAGPAEFLGRSEHFGTVEVGKRAELLLLNADPLADIRNTRTIRAVFTNGRVYERAALDRMTARLPNSGSASVAR
jgi:imidazolonepropionase-like amidohydrolase